MSTINVGQSLQSFTQDKWHAYSGILTGDVTVPATITLIDIPNTGLKDAFVKIQPCFGPLISTSNDQGIGISVLIDGVEVFKQRRYQSNLRGAPQIENSVELFVPKQSRLQVLSLNTTGNNTQERGVTVLGWYV